MSTPRWSQRARADLKAIHDYIAKDSALNAKVVVRDILARAATLPDTPRVGRRVIYQLRREDVFIVTLVHRRRAPAPEQLRG